MTAELEYPAMTTTAANVASMFLERVQTSANREAFRYLVDDRWVSATWQQSADRVETLAAGLLALGIDKEQRVGIASSTRYEWILADLSIMCSGAATTTVYSSTNARDTAFILADSDCRIVFAENGEQLAKLSEHRDELPNLTKVVLFDGPGDGDWAITLAELSGLENDYLVAHPSGVRSRTDSIAPAQLATLIYTSGTTGRPKGVRLSHASWVYEATSVANLNFLDEHDLQLLWLPMAHAFGKVLITTQLACGFATAIDGRVDKIVENMAVVKPTFMGGGTTDLREGTRPHRHHRASQGGPSSPAVLGGILGRARRGPSALCGPACSTADVSALRSVGPLGVQQGARGVRWAHPVFRVRGGSC